jgi:hypothetical protein
LGLKGGFSGERVDFPARINELIGRRGVGLAGGHDMFRRIRLGGSVFLLTFGLQLAELAEGFFLSAIEALFVEAQVDEGF